MTRDLQRLAQQIAHGQESIAEMEAMLGQGAEYVARLAADERYGLRSPASFIAALAREGSRAAEINDDLGVLEIALDRELSVIEHLRVVQGLYKLANRTGEQIGRTERGGYAAFFPWASEREMQNLTRAAEHMVAQIAPDAEIQSGWILGKGDEPETLLPELATINRTQGPLLTASHGR